MAMLREVAPLLYKEEFSMNDICMLLVPVNEIAEPFEVWMME